MLYLFSVSIKSTGYSYSECFVFRKKASMKLKNQAEQEELYIPWQEGSLGKTQVIGYKSKISGTKENPH